jgi:23S rRNA (cytidine1920-2'-O)/16S rRNA (cytidine1409-2'-O)-methyltransferase
VVPRRLDQALVASGLAPSRARAQALIASGAVRVDGRVAARAAAPVADGARLEVVGNPLPWVSRAALKLRHGLEVFGLDPRGAVALDLGASTGGFSQVLLQAGAAEVWAVDVGHGQFAPALRTEPRLRLIEGLNARDLGPAHVPPPDWIVADLSFIPLAVALPPALALARPGAVLVALIKPQFEVGPRFVGKGGIVRDAAAIARARSGVRDFLIGEGWDVIGETASPIAGGDGNAEFLVAAVKPVTPPPAAP